MADYSKNMVRIMDLLTRGLTQAALELSGELDLSELEDGKTRDRDMGGLEDTLSPSKRNRSQQPCKP